MGTCWPFERRWYESEDKAEEVAMTGVEKVCCRFRRWAIISRKRWWEYGIDDGVLVELGGEC